MDRERIVQLFFFGFLALMAYELYEVLYPFLTPIAWAILLAFLVHPALIHLHRVVKNTTTCALIITVVVALGVILPALWISERLAAEAQSIYTTISKTPKGQGLDTAIAWFYSTRVGDWVEDLLARHGLNLEDEVRRFTAQGVQLTSAYVIEHGSSVASNVATTVFHFALALLTFFYLLRDGEYYFSILREITPLHEEDKHLVFETLGATLSSVMRGLMLTAVLDGVSIGLGYLVVGLPYWAFLALLTAACGLLPFGGTTLVWVPAALYLAFAHGWTSAIVLVIWASIALAIIDNFIKPIAMKHGTGLPTVALFFGLAGGIEAYGPLGIFAGPAVMSIFAALLRVYRRTYSGDQPAAAAVPAVHRPRAAERSRPPLIPSPSADPGGPSGALGLYASLPDKPRTRRRRRRRRTPHKEQPSGAEESSEPEE